MMMATKLLMLAALLALTACGLVQPNEPSKVAVRPVSDSERCINKQMKDRPACYQAAIATMHEVQ